ncbi:MAG: serine/threonine-protein kinase PknK, partial [Myxococcales bacterium]|nr:serine/threonine-protein kinase PknK [Myxococcales bacterium]
MPALAAQKLHPHAHPQAFAGRYQCQKRLSVHNGIETWKGVDRDLDAPVVIKFESDEQPHPGASDRLKKEAESLSECNTTELVKIIDSGTDDGTRFVVVEFVSGPSLRQHLDTQGPMDPVAALTVFRCVFSALANMHKNDFVHGDVKPENIIIISEADGLHGKLIDCGFASRPNEDDHLILIGGVQYAAPERLGLIGIDYDFRSDLYAAGASLYECLTGTPPFTGRNRSEIIDRMLNCPLSPARELRPTLPGSFDAVLSRLLQRDPTNRYHSAGAVLHDLGRIEKNITLGMPDAPLFAGASDRRKTITTPTFVGREEELKKAASAFQAAGQGSPAVLLVEAISGGGKTYYLDEAAVRARSRGAFVFRGGALGDVAPTPFGALESAVQQVVDAAETDPRF